MAAPTDLRTIQAYLQAVNNSGIHVNQAVLFGSWARGEAGPESDIDLVVIAPEFDGQKNRQLVNRLWELTAIVPEAWRIEPIACGERQWLEDSATPILEIARQEGQIISLIPAVA